MTHQGSLTFTRQPGDCFAIGEDITISIVKIRRHETGLQRQGPA
jgi:sRNA-binding carbon storage regulator CsrA